MVGEGEEGGKGGEEGVSIRRQTGVRRSLTSFFFFPPFPSSSMEGAEA